MKHLRRVTNCKSDTTSALQCDLLIFLWPCSNCAPTREKAYVAWTPSNKSPGQGVAGREKSLLQTPSLSLDSYRNMSLPSPRTCVTLSLILKVFICGWQFHVPVGRGNNYRKELIFDQGGGIGWWRGCDRNLGRKLLSYIYICCSHFYDNQFHTVYLNTPKSIWVFVRAYFLIWVSKNLKPDSQTAFTSFLSVIIR